MNIDQNQQHLPGVSTSGKESFFSQTVNVLEKYTRLLNEILHKISSVLLFLLMFLTLGDVVGRTVFNSSITGTYELTGLMLSIIIFFSLGKTQLLKGHIEIDFLTNKLETKTEKILETVVSLILFILMALITWQLSEYARRTFYGNELTGDLELPLWIFIALTIVGAFAFTLTYLLDGIQSFLKVVNKDES